MQIVRVSVKDFKGIKLVELLPKKTMTLVGGKNRAGKSSLLDAIGANLGGKRLCPEHPIRRGQEKGYVEVEIDGDAGKLIPACTVRRDFWKKKSGEIESKLEIITKEGYRAPSPQTLLADITGALGFDPESFLRMSAREQAEMLRVLVGLDFSALDVEYSNIYAARRAVNANGVKARLDLERMPFHPEAPSGEISAAALIGELKARQAHNADNAKLARAVAIQRASADMLQREVTAQQRFVEDLEERLAVAKEKSAALVAQAHAAAVEVTTAECTVAMLVDQDTAEIEQQIADSETLNRKVRENVKRREAEMDLDVQRDKSAALTAKLQAIEAEKAARQAAATWPVAGLGYTADGVTYNELPFDQVSASEQRRVAVSIACALQPTLRFFFLKDGSLLDDESKAEFAQLAAEKGCQCFLEVVGKCDGTSIVIADGEVEWAEQGMLPLEPAELLPEEP